MFGRRTAKKDDPQVVEETDARVGGKGRPTPKRSEAERARKKRMTPPRTRKEAAALQRERARTERQQRMKGVKSGDERYLPARDRGPVRRFVRDFVDSRRSAAEFALPAMLVVLLVSLAPAPEVAAMSTLGFMLILVFTLVDTALLEWRLGRQLKVRFPDESTKGAGWYAFMRSSQMRFSRLPKAQVKPGEKLPDRYA